MKSSLFVFLLLFTGCQYSFLNLEYDRGKKALKSKDFNVASKHFRRVVVRDPESSLALKSSRQGAKINYFETKNYPKAIEFYNHLVTYSKNGGERKRAQKQIALIYFDKMSKYKQAIAAYNQLLGLENSVDELFVYKFAIARSYFYLNNFFQSKVEIEEILKLKIDKGKRFEVKLFLGNVYYNTKKLKQAISTFKELVAEDPDRSAAENVSMSIVAAYEELNQFDQGIQVLQDMRATYEDPDFIDLKIKQLEERRSNLPGYKGLRK